MNDLLAPIVLFVYNRAEHTKKTLEALHNANLSGQSRLFIYADGAKVNATPEAISKIDATRELIKSQQWCGEVVICESPTNKGLAQNIITGVTEIVNRYGKVIVLEDDIVIGKHYLEYTNKALDKYRDNKNVWEIAGFCDPFPVKNPNAVWFCPIEHCWGWATWSDRWQYFKKDPDYYIENFTHKMRKDFNADGAVPDMWNQIRMNKEGSLNTWAIFWAAAIFEHKGLSCAPTKSLVKNIGFDGSGEHSSSKNDMEEIIDSIDGEISYLPDVVEISEYEYQAFKDFMRKKNLGLKKIIYFYTKRFLSIVGLYKTVKQIMK